MISHQPERQQDLRLSIARTEDLDSYPSFWLQDFGGIKSPLFLGLGCLNSKTEITYTISSFPQVREPADSLLKSFLAEK